MRQRLISPMPNDRTRDADGKPGPEDWRELARKIERETDPNKMIELVQELIAKFDQDRLRKGQPPTREIRNRSGSPDA
jgi:hypothetical protein